LQQSDPVFVWYARGRGGGSHGAGGSDEIQYRVPIGVAAQQTSSHLDLRELATDSPKAKVERGYLLGVLELARELRERRWPRGGGSHGAGGSDEIQYRVPIGVAAQQTSSHLDRVQGGEWKRLWDRLVLGLKQNG
jgi:hypothetical protein